MRGAAGIFFLLIGSYLGPYLPTLAAELVSSNYQFGDLRLQYLPPENDGGEQITKYKIEWDATTNTSLLPSFAPSSMYFGSSEVTNVREEQEIIVSCRSACSGTFLLSWGGRIADEPLNVDATSDEVELALSKLLEPFNMNSDGSSPVRVTRKANGFAFKWRVSFLGISGDVGLIQVNGDLLVGSGATVRVVEVTRGSSDLYPGAYTNEVQTVSIHKRPGFGCETLSGDFALSFEGKVTASIDVDTSAADFKDALESLDSIHTVNVKTDHHNSIGVGDCSSRSWIVTFTHLVHENRQGAGDIGLLRLSSSSLSDPSVTQVKVFENVKGSNPSEFNLRGLQHGLTYHCRVSAYNSLGYGVSSSTVTATPKIQPSPPLSPIVSIPSEVNNNDNLGTSLSVSWHSVADSDNNGGDPVTDYKLEWYSDVENLEVQKLTTSANDGIIEVQAIAISADTDGITGFFTLTFDGETTELIAHDAEADGEESIEMKLERLSTVGDVEVSRDYSWTSIPNVEFDLVSGSNVLSRVGGSYAGNFMELFAVGDLIRVGNEVHTVSSVGTTFLMTNDNYSGPSATNVNIHTWSFGYEWLVTFISHVGKQPLLEASPANNWAGTNPVIEVNRVREGLQPLSGTIRLGFEGERTLPIPFDADALLMKQALESLSSIGEVDVVRFRNNNGHNYFITFISELGDREMLTVDDSQLMGPDARARVASLIEGTEPTNYGSTLVSHQMQSTSMQYQVNGLENGTPYFVRLRSRNSKGFGYAALATPSPITPVKRPSSPTSVAMIPLSNTRIRVSWQDSPHDGGSSITKYVVQFDVDDSFPSAWIEGFFYEEYVQDDSNVGGVHCHTFTIDPSSSGVLRYARVLAFNGYQWSDSLEAPVVSASPGVNSPGPVKDFNAFPTSNIGMMLSWNHPSINDDESCDVAAGDGGSSITHYLVEYDTKDDFSSAAVSSITVPSTSTELRIGGRDVLSGSELSTLEASGIYYARITPFNSVGPGTTTTFPTPIGPLIDTIPSPPVVRNAVASSASSIQVEWDTPVFDGGSVIQEYIVEYDVDSSFQSTPKNITIPTVSEVKAIQVGSNELELNVHTIRATVAVTNEVQSVKTTVEGVDEVQEFSTTCDDVTAEVQMIVTTAVDTNEEQVVSLISDDIDEIQLFRLQGDNQVEVQSVQVSVPRVNEVQKFGIVISNINTDGDGVHSTACTGINVGDSCQDIEDALAGSFTVSFDFDDCGGGDVNYCQLALSEYEPKGGVSCSPGLVIDPYVGGDHCVSEPVSHSYTSSEGDVGTLQQVLNGLVDDNGNAFMTSANVPGKQQAVTVTRKGRIKTKGGCLLDSVGSDPATCTGEYELLYEIEFDAVHSSGDVPPLTIVTSDFRLDTTSASYTDNMCPSAYFVDGCEDPTGAALDANHGSFYNGEAGSFAFEATKGSQPTGMVILDYVCESIVTVLPGGSTMTVSSDGMSASFDSVGYVGNMSVGQHIRFSAGDGIDYYRKIAGVDGVTDSITFETQAPVNNAIYTDVEYGDYFSDWNESDGGSGVSSYCQAARAHATLPIDVTTPNSAMSETDWRGKIGAMSVIDSSGISVSRNLMPDLSSDIGLIWDVTFQKQPGNVHEIVCSTVSGTNQCSVNTLQDSSVIGGGFKLQTTWPHEYVSDSPQMYETSLIRWNSDASTLKMELESITDFNGDKVFGLVDVARSPYVSPSESRWSGGYFWTITFLSRGGNIPSLTFDDSSLTGTNPILEVSDEDSGVADLYQGSRNSAAFVNDDPGLARDGNQVSGSFSLSWSGSAYHDAVITTNIFTVQTGGSSSDQYTALSADSFKALFEEHVLSNSANQIDVVRSEQPTQWMGFAYTIIFRHEDVGGDVPLLTYMLNSPLKGTNSYVSVDETVKGTEIVGTFQLRYEGETTRPINHDATPQDVQEALNELNSIAPSAVIVSGGESPIRSGPSDGSGGMSTQVGGRIWYVTFASNVWQDPTVVHDSSSVPGNWVGPPASTADTWSSGFSKAWGKNVGNVPMMSCLQSGLSTTNGALPDGGCSVSELVAGTDPLGGSFKICLDTASNPNNVMSVEIDTCTDFIAHNAVASANESGGDGSSVEEKLEQLDNVGDVQVTRSAVNPRNGGYTWEVQFLYDVDGPCQQKDDILSLCNSPGNVPKLCDSSGATPCDTTSLKGTCLKPGSCDKLTSIDATGKINGELFPGGNERQVIYVKDVNYLGWEDGSALDSSSVLKEYTLQINGDSTTCIKHNALANEMATSIQAVLDSGVGGSVRVDRTRSEHLAANGFVYYLTFYDTGDLSPITASYADGACANDFEAGQSVVVTSTTDGNLHSATCENCVDGIIQRGDFTTFDVTGDGLVGAFSWNAEPSEVKTHLEQSSGREVDVTRLVLDKYGTIEWMVTFTKNVGSTPPGSGDIDSIVIAQDADTSGREANVVVNEIIKGSGSLSGTFTLDYQSSGGPRTFSFDESPQRMQRKLEEMSTIGSVFVTKDCFPESCSLGGWGGMAVVPGTVGGYEWNIYFLSNPGSFEGFTFPPGSGVIHPPSIDHTLLNGKDAMVVMDSSSTEGSDPLTGNFNVVVNGESTYYIPYNVDALSLQHLINDLQSVGDVAVESGIQTNHVIEGITASVTTDGTVASLTGGGELREHLAPGDMFRIGGSIDEIDGADKVGSASLTSSSPILSDVNLDTRNRINVDETVRIGADNYSIVKNGVEVQQIAVHRSNGIVDGDFYQLKVTIQGVVETTACLTFDSSATDVESALNSLPILSNNGGVFVTKSDTTTGFVGNAHFLKVYFSGEQLVGDVEEMIAEQCITGVPPGVDSTNSHVYIRTLTQGGKTEHQRVTLNVDSGSTSETPAFRLSISDLNTNSWESPCYAWGTPSLGLASIMDNDVFSSNALIVDSVYDLGNNQYKIGTTSFVEGILLVGDYINPGNRCPGKVLSIEADGKSVVIESVACTAMAADALYVGSDVTIIESFTDNGASVSEKTLVTVYSDAEIQSSDALYKINVEFEGVVKSTSCLQYGAPAQDVQQEIGSLFDYNQDGLIDASDTDHISVTRKGDGSSSFGYGYSYEFLSNGSSSSIGPSAVLGSNAPKFSVVDIGADGGCVDYGIDEEVVTNTASTTDESNMISLGPDAIIAINAGTRLRTSSSLVPSKVYTVHHTSIDGSTLFLTENFDGSSTTGVTLSIIGGGVPHFDVEVAREGVDEYVYDIFFTGSHWINVPQITLNVFGDGVCSAGNSDITDGMNRGIGIKTLTNGGGGFIDDSSDQYVLDRVVRSELRGSHDLYVVPPVLTIQSDLANVQQIIVKDDDNNSIWGSGSPSYKLSIGGEHTSCLAHNALESEIEDELNALTSICSGLDPCVTVTRRLDSVLAPNGHVYTMYFSSTVDGLVADTTHVECNAFDVPGGETVVVSTLSQGKDGAEYSSNQVPFSTGNRWLGDSSTNLPIYRVSGKYHFVRFGESLGNVHMVLDSSSLSTNAYASVVEPDMIDGLNPDRVIIPNLSTGIEHYSRLYSRTSFGFSSPSDTISAKPSDKPEKLRHVVAGHALHQTEVQSVVIAATHQKEVQAVQTSAMAIPEVQEITLEGTDDSDMSTYFFSLRQPEIQVVKWSSGSPVTEGSFYLQLRYVDRVNSNLSGTIIYKEMKTPCINFDATADDVKRAMELDAVLNGLGVDSVSVTRSGNRSFSSDYGYSFKITFVGGDVRGNLLQLTSDTALTGVDSSGGNTCTAFVSPTNDASLDIWTENDQTALGTDTPRAEIIVDANMPIVDGEFQLSVTHYGQQLTTECIPWDGTAGQVKTALENLANVDSVRVVRTGNGVLSDDGAHIKIDDYSFSHIGSNSFLASPSDGLSDILFEGDIIKLSGQTDPSGTFYKIVSLAGDGTMILDKPFTGDTSIASHVVTRYFGYRYVIYFDGNAMHTDGTDSSGFMPLQGSNFIVSDPSTCKPFQAYHNNVLMDMASIPESIGNVRAVSKYDGEHTLPGAPTSASSATISQALTSSLPTSVVSEAQVTQSIETDENDITFTITYGNDDGNVPLFICNHSPSLTSLAGCETSTVMDGNELRGNFYLGSSDPIPYNASPSEMELALSGVSGIGQVEVSRSQPDGQQGHTWLITFYQYHGDVEPLHVSSSLTAKGASVSVTEITKGNELGGSFRLSFGSETTNILPFDVDKESLASALEALDNIGHVDVTTTDHLDSELRRSFEITFLDSALGDVPLLVADSTQLTGLGGATFVSEVVKGSLAAKDSLSISFDLPQSCSTSDVSRAYCGDPISEGMIELSPSLDFSVATTSYQYIPDYSTQIIRTACIGALPRQTLSGYFKVEYDKEMSVPINAHASEDEVRDAIEGLPSVETVSVERDYASQVVENVCIDVAVGSSLVVCSTSCSPCDFGSKGIKANQLIKIEEKWYRVSSFYDGVQESFSIATVNDSSIISQYVGENSLNESTQLQVWTGGYEWTVSFHSVLGEVKPLSTPMHNLLPRQAAVEISLQDCNECMYLALSPDTQYYIRARVKNSRGWSEYSDVISQTPRAIPSAPTHVNVNAISGECLEVVFAPPVYGQPITAYVVQWDFNEHFTSLDEDASDASCTSIRYGNCVISQLVESSPMRHEICGLLESAPTIDVVRTNGCDTGVLGGHFSLSLDGETTDNIAFDASALDVKFELEKIASVGKIKVTRRQLQDESFEWTITFLDSIGNIPLLSVNDYLTCS